MRAFICGLQGLVLLQEEREFLIETSPWGVILFRRNIDDRDQLKRLIADVRTTLGRHAPILVDQEGGRVQRLNLPNWRAYPSAATFLQLAPDPDAAARLAFIGARLIAHDLKEVGIDVDCLPVLDTPTSDAHAIISDRAYSHDPKVIAQLGRAAANGLMSGGVAPVMKHIPGHGRARADSHLELPIVSSSLDTLKEIDFQPFQNNADLPMAMTAHVVYDAIDPSAPGTLSRTIVQDIIRGVIGFEGLLMTDDLSMKALSGDFRDRAEKAIHAGCDMVLHCNGDLLESRRVAEGSPILAGESAQRALQALTCVTTASQNDIAELEAEFNQFFDPRA
ncbi:MAG: beta-N-acetylhexosaminidase [Methylocystaceae bacterium]|jgi:beta-N-acetylhexosaminidase|nr:beta-N-acetylhexosaminidase [Methylocystaceae bacterium]